MAVEIENKDIPEKTMTKWEMLSALIIVLLLAGSILFAYVENTINISNSYLVGLFGVAFISIAIPSAKVLRIRQLDAFRAAGSLLIMLFIAAGISITVWSVFVSAVGLYEYTTNKVDVPVLTSIAIVFGTGLWKVRVTARAFYGAVEVVAGVGLTAFNALNNSGPAGKPSPQLYAAILTGGIFLIVRGLDNMEQGLKYSAGKFADTWVQWLSDWVEKQVLWNQRAFEKMSKPSADQAELEVPPMSPEEVADEIEKQEQREQERLKQLAVTDQMINELYPPRTPRPAKPVSYSKMVENIQEAMEKSKANASEQTGKAVTNVDHFIGQNGQLVKRVKLDGNPSANSSLRQQMVLANGDGIVLSADEFNNLSLGGKANATAFSKIAPVSYEDNQKGMLRLQNQYGAWISINEFNQLSPQSKSQVRAVYDKFEM